MDPQLPTETSGSPDTTVYNSNTSLSTPITVWVITDKSHDTIRLHHTAHENNFNLQRTLTLDQTDRELPKLLEEMESDPPDLIWMLAPDHKPGRALNTRGQTASRVLLKRQLEQNRHVTIEAATDKPTTHGFFVSPGWYDEFPQLQRNRLWWCALAIGNKDLSELKKCIYSHTVSSFPLPSRYLSCCGRVNNQRGIRPKHVSTNYLLPVLKVLREALRPTSAELKPLHNLSTESAFPTNSKERSKKTKAQGAKTITEDDGPGEHEANFVPLIQPKKKVIEDTYDDCGDDVSKLVLDDDISVQANFVQDSTSVPFDVFTTWDMETTYDSEFMNWSLQGSTAENDDYRPSANYVSNFYTAYEVIDKQHSAGSHDIVEIFGGKAGVTKIAIRYKLNTGPNFDLVSNIDLTDPEEVKMFWRYMYRHRPRVVVAGPPCTALGGWSHYNRIHHPEKWKENYVIGKALGLFVAQVAKFQLDHRRHFVIENPISSDLWSFPEFQALLQRTGVTFVRGDQCCYGLKDPTGIPTLKPTGFLCSSPILAKRLSRRCDNSHTHVPLAGQVNGISRCKFAQVWPDALCQAVVQGILEVLNHDNMYLVIAADISQDLTHVFPATDKCPGCSCHARRDDPRHNRKEGVCRFPFDRSLSWKCPACIKYLPSTHGNHLLDDTCQWSDIQRRVGVGMREPKPKPTDTALQEPSAEPDHPPPVDGMKWKPVIDIEIITKLQTLSSGSRGWVSLDSNTVSVDVSNARVIRGPEPRFSLSIYNKRSSFGYFPELIHDNGVWWQLENQTELLTNQARDIGFRVPLLIIFFHKADTSTKNNTRKGPLQNSLDVSTSSAPAAVPSSSSTSRVRHLGDIPEESEVAEPIGDGEEPTIPIQQLGQEPLGEAAMPNQDPEWSSYDLGRALRALRSGNAGLQAHTLKRLHLRWWHCTATRMAALLKAANVPGEAIAMIPGIVNSCKICRLWQKPSNRSVHASRLSEKFNEAIQFDILFVEDMVIAVAIDEATRFCMARIITSRETEQILRFLTNDWIRIFGKPNLILSDQEGGLHSEEGAIWLERHCISGKPVPKGAHASIVERHHQTLRSTIHRLLAQARSEGLIVSGPDIVAESVYAKNCLTSVNGYSPYEAVLGRRPNMLMDLDNPTISALDDTTGEVIGANRHATRLREMAIASVVESTAQARMKLAEQSKTRISSQSLNLQPGSLVDIYRTPSKKDLSGWRGPCQVIAVRDGTIDIKWNGRVLICRPQDVRIHLISAFLVDSEAPQFHVLQEHLRSVFNEVKTLAWVFTDKGWQLSKAAQEHPQVLRAILFIATNMLQLTRCIGARIGRGFHVLGGLSSVTTCVLMWWPTERPALYQTLIHDGNQAVSLRQTIGDSDGTSNDYSWAQFLGVAVHQARRIRRTAPDLPHLHPDDPNDPPWLAPPPDAPMNAPPPDNQAPQPMDTDKTTLAPRDYDPIPVDSHRSNKPPPPPKPPPRIPKYQRPSSPRTGPQRHPIPSTASSSHRPWKQQAKDDKPTEPMPPQQQARDDKPAKQPSPQHSDKPAQRPSPQHQVGGSSSSSGPTPNVPLNIPAHVPILPISGQDDADEHTDSDATHGWADELDRDDFLCVVSRDGQILMSYFDKAQDIESSMPKAPGDLTPTEIKQHWTEVAAAVRKELKSFIDLDVWEIRKKGSSGNRMTAKMLLKWKLDPVSLQRLCKARLTVRGFQDKDRHTQTFASTATRWGQRIIVMLATQQQWSLVTADIGSAFLRGLTFEQLAQLTGEPLRQCAFEFPKDYLEFLWELDGHNHFDPNLHELFMLKPVYGLQDAPRAWRKRLHIALISTHGRPLATDACIYVWYRLQDNEQKLRGALSTHVDDLKICGPDEFISYLITFLEKEFGKLKVQRGKFEHCGLVHEIQDDGSIVVHQNHYAQRLKNIDLTGLPLDQPTQLCLPAQVEQFMSGVGSLAWMSQTRLDVLVHIQSLQRASKSPTIGHLVRLNIVIKWVRRKPLHIKYVRLLTASLKILVINDAAFRREDASGLAMRGSVIALAEDGPDVGGRLMLVDYYSKRQRKVVRSTFGAETHAAADGTEIGKLVAYTFAEIMTPGITAAGILRLEAEGRLLTPLHIITDCKSLYDALRMDEIQVPSESSLIMVLLQLKESLRSGSIKAITWCDTRDMCADGLNKGIIARKGLRDLATSGFWKLEHNSATHTESSKISIAAEVIDSPELVQARSQLAAHVY